MKPSPSLAPTVDFDTYIVLDEFEKFRVYREADETEADRVKVIEDISNGQYNKPVRVVSFNTAEGWSRDVTEDIAREILDQALRKGEQLSAAAQEFLERVLDDEIPSSISADH
jgi:uncharacterized protein YabE (DUF348 family)